jgi:hypothetical protein
MLSKICVIKIVICHKNIFGTDERIDRASMFGRISWVYGIEK